LVKQSLNQTDFTIVSVFVNPLQFNNASDLEKYPRTFEADTELLQLAGCHAVFFPSTKVMYQTSAQVTLDFGTLDKMLEGKFRPGHFSGVGVIVSKLFNIIHPDVAYFGQKDYQQYLVISKLVQDLSFPVRLVCGDIVREPNGLAMSSRNQRLSPEEKKIAAILYQSLTKTKEWLYLRSIIEIRREVEALLSSQGIRLEYFELADRTNLNLMTHFDASIPSILLIAAYLGEVRLIDNIIV
jgi:pantoate--beta-alanine ligase